MLEKTPWYPCSVLPVRVGWYEVEDDLSHRARLHLTGNRRYWDGQNWKAGWTSDKISIFGMHPSHKWRGITQQEAKRHE